MTENLLSQHIQEPIEISSVAWAVSWKPLNDLPFVDLRATPVLLVHNNSNN